MTVSGTRAPGERLGEGQEAEVLAWGDDSVLKLYRGDDSSARAGRELRNLRLAAEGGVRVPEPRGTAVVEGRTGAIMERVAGPDLLAHVGKRPWRLDWAARELARMHVRLHEATASADLPSARELLRGFFASDPGALGVLPEGLRTQALALLATLPEGHVLCHGDYHPGNLFVSDGEVVVIDWPNMCRGTPETDVGRTLVLMEAGVIPATGAERVLIAALRRVFIRRYLAHYRKVRRLDMVQVREWRLVHALERYVTQPEQRPALRPMIRRAFGIVLEG